MNNDIQLIFAIICLGLQMKMHKLLIVDPFPKFDINDIISNLNKYPSPFNLNTSIYKIDSLLSHSAKI